MALIAPSLLAANFLQLEKECKMVNESEADWFHLDVMDGQFVPNISFGPMIIDFISKIAKKPCDVHLMVKEPMRFAQMFKDAGADHLIIHIEACPNLHHDVATIKAMGMKPGVAINPATPVAGLADILPDIHHICMMSVDPGFGGQKFIPHTLDKIKELRRMIDDKHLRALIEIDGGVTVENAQSIIDAGAHVLVAGSTVFKAADPYAVIQQLKKIESA